MFDPDLLRAFVSVMECGGFTRAGERLHLSQSTVSQQVRRLEELIGRPLLRRTTRRVVPNDDGEVMLVHAQQILASMQKAWSQLTAPRIEAGTVRLGVTEEIAITWLPPLLLRFSKAYPQVRLDLSVGITRELIVQLDQGELDLVLGKRRIGDDRGESMGADRLVWIGRAEAIRFAGADSVRLVVFPSSCIYRACMVETLQSSGLSWDISCTSPSLAGILAIVKAGLGITALPEVFVDDLTLHIPADFGLPALPNIEFAVFGAGGEATPAVQEFRRLLEQDAEERNLAWLLVQRVARHC